MRMNISGHLSSSAAAIGRRLVNRAPMSHGRNGVSIVPSRAATKISKCTNCCSRFSKSRISEVVRECHCCRKMFHSYCRTGKNLNDHWYCGIKCMNATGGEPNDVEINIAHVPADTADCSPKDDITERKPRHDNDDQTLIVNDVEEVNQQNLIGVGAAKCQCNGHAEVILQRMDTIVARLDEMMNKFQSMKHVSSEDVSTLVCELVQTQFTAISQFVDMRIDTISDVLIRKDVTNGSGGDGDLIQVIRDLQKQLTTPMTHSDSTHAIDGDGYQTSDKGQGCPTIVDQASSDAYDLMDDRPRQISDESVVAQHRRGNESVVKTIYIKIASDDIDELNIENHCRGFGQVIRCSLNKNLRCAFIEFATRDQAIDAVMKSRLYRCRIAKNNIRSAARNALRNESKHIDKDSNDNDNR